MFPFIGWIRKAFYLEIEIILILRVKIRSCTNDNWPSFAVLNEKHLWGTNCEV